MRVGPGGEHGVDLAQVALVWRTGTGAREKGPQHRMPSRALKAPQRRHLQRRAIGGEAEVALRIGIEQCCGGRTVPPLRPAVRAAAGQRSRSAGSTRERR